MSLTLTLAGGEVSHTDVNKPLSEELMVLFLSLLSLMLAFLACDHLSIDLLTLLRLRPRGFSAFILMRLFGTISLYVGFVGLLRVKLTDLLHVDLVGSCYATVTNFDFFILRAPRTPMCTYNTQSSFQISNSFNLHVKSSTKWWFQEQLKQN